MSLYVWLAAFTAITLLDVAWVFYTRSMMRNAPGVAACWATAIHGFSVVATVAYVGDHRYISATLLGTFVGTYAVVRWTKSRDAKVNT